MTTRYLVDTNVLLRFLTGQPLNQAEATKKLLEDAAAGEVVLEVSPVIAAEAYYTLTSFYEIPRAEAARKIAALLRRRGVKVSDSVQVFDALDRLQRTNVGFADAFLAAGAAMESVSVASFDRDLDRFDDIERFEPK
ncbi:MAG TPA: PIN domain-containing protein [Verrucomicrobiota bacterium]|nr:PIN domain nuclease [Verrucomicrobiales bacterium]HRI11516.1 PIN domain-containing protein [Verrucomicrobiota bacterium]